MAFVAAKCPQCGGNIQVDDTKEAGICPFCKTAFVTEKAIHNYHVNIVNNVDTVIVQSDAFRITSERCTGFLKVGDYRRAFDVAAEAPEKFPGKLGAYLLYLECAEKMYPEVLPDGMQEKFVYNYQCALKLLPSAEEEERAAMMRVKVYCERIAEAVQEQRARRAEEERRRAEQEEQAKRRENEAKEKERIQEERKIASAKIILIVLLVVLSVIGAAVIAGYIVGLCITNEPALYVIFSVGLFIAALFIGVPIAYVVHKLKELQK